MAGALTDPDPLDALLRDLAGRLHGPARLKRGLLAEVRAGLHDAVEAHTAGGADPAEARRRAVAEFGSPAELAPLFQAGIGATQGRRTALVLASAFPGLLLGWDLMWHAGVDWAGTPSPAVRLLARAQDLASLAIGVTALVGALLLVRCARTGRDPRLLARAAAWLGIGGAGSCAGLAIAMNLLAGADTGGVVAVDRPAAAAPAYVATGLVLGLVVRSIVGTLRATRSVTT